MSDRNRPHRRPPVFSTRRRALAAVTSFALVGGLALSGSAPAASADAVRHRDGVQADLDRLVREEKFPAALAAVRTSDGRARNHTAGVAELGTKRKPPVDGRVRIGSNTKTFVATVVLQLVGEGKVDLDEPIETYLPDLVRGDGIDGRQITVRQVLQHTSGLPRYVDDIAPDFFLLRHTYFEPRDLLDLALANKASFAPGTKWEYSNTNYLVAGLLIQKVTGRPVAEEITNRIIVPLKLRDTYFPNVGEQGIRGRHPHGYYTDDPDKPLQDVTKMDPSWGWAAGAMISSPSDTNRFFTALLDGDLLRPAELDQMRTTVPAFPGRDYGLGLMSWDLPCGGRAWGHGGDVPGFTTRGGVTEDGRAVTLTVTAPPPTESAAGQVEAAVDGALCE
ncbi:serine hydrolase [Salinispora sp. H7-4]|uniref:serine hydrolase domain-containing protein n=1 Tax=Salinispora sp. H7-4 TaxID=2748321 RepID=UPI0015D46B9F|nr:serine hydrolase domain-containing protein [Salinispora sp. H7-4]NYT93159.1 beta-lactamase family protein [Salinispora sp. H7-4]